LRQDIQFLRGWAVSIVVLQHAGLGPIAGYLGVDVFFVISGYLITRLLQKQLEAGDFSFTEFYLRRAKRLLPAAYVTFALTALAAPYFLSTIQLNEFQDQLLGALAFYANMALYGQSGYFDGAAEFKPLLHIWSLSLEEQYYFILPLLLFLTGPRLWIYVAISAFVISLGLCLYFLSRDPSFAFYALPTRAWELSGGSLIALAQWDVRPHRFFRLAFWPASAVVLGIPFFPTGLPHPSLDAALVCIATAIVIINGRRFFERYPLSVVAKVGDFSYSLYLVHWPVMAFINSAYLGEVPLHARVIAVALALILGVALYLFVERPIHRARSRPSVLKSACAALLLGTSVYAIPNVTVASTSHGLNFVEIRRPNRGLADACDQKTNVFRPLNECVSSPKTPPTHIVWGDSFAMHLVQGLAVDPDFSFIQATQSSCPPVFGYAQFNRSTRYNEEWARRCMAFNDSVFRYLTGEPAIETVVIGSTFRGLTMRSPWQALVRSETNDFKREKIAKDLSTKVLLETVKALREAGKRVIIFAPPPASRVDPSECIERKVRGLTMFSRTTCSISREHDLKMYGQVMDILRTVASEADVEVIDPREWMCDEQACETIEDDIPLYRDATHLSAVGSAYLGRRNDWAGLVRRYAR